MRRKGYQSYLALALAVVLTGCTAPAPEVTATPEPTPSPTAAATADGLAFVLPCYPMGGFHPITGTNRLNLTLAPLLYRGLFALDRGFEPRMELCESYEVSEDGLRWTFQLAQATFSDGTPLTASQVAASLNAARKSDRYGERLSGIIKVAAAGEAVVVTLSRANGALPSLLDVPIVKETDDPLRPLGTGPYYLVEDEGLYLAAREDAAAPVERIPLRTVGSSDDLVYAFDTREISLVDTDLTGTNMPGYSGLLETTDYPTTGLLYVGCNASSGACREQAVRRAVALALDREGMARQVLGDHAVASALPIHPYAGNYDAQAAGTLAYDPAGALEALTGAGWTADEEGMLVKRRNRLTLRLIVNQENTYKVSLAEELGAALTGLGCVVTVEKLPWDSFLTALKKGDFDLYLGETVLTADFDLEALLGAKGELNYGKYWDSDLGPLLEEYQGAAGEARSQAAAALWEHLAECCPILPVCFKNGSVLTQWGQIRGMAPTQRDVFAGMESWTVTSQ